MTQLEDTLSALHGVFEDSAQAAAYAARHGISTASVLTVTNDETADAITQYLAPRIAGKTVVEIGGGIGVLSLHMGTIAKRVYCIEVNPMWSWIFATQLYFEKSKNVSFILGAADEFVGAIKADVVVFCSHSGLESLKLVGQRFAPEVIDVYSEIIDNNPAGFDELARVLRKVI